MIASSHIDLYFYFFLGLFPHLADMFGWELRLLSVVKLYDGICRRHLSVAILRLAIAVPTNLNIGHQAKINDK